MNLYFPIWLAYMVAILIALFLLFVMVWLVATFWIEVIDKTRRATRLGAAFFWFYAHREAHHGWATIAEAHKDNKKLEEELRVQRGLAGWALWHLNRVTDGAVGERHYCLPHNTEEAWTKDDEDKQLREALVPYEAQWNAYEASLADQKQGESA